MVIIPPKAERTTPLREQMRRTLKQLGYADNSIESYVEIVRDFASYHGKSPDLLTEADIRSYLEHLASRLLKAA